MAHILHAKVGVTCLFFGGIESERYSWILCSWCTMASGLCSATCVECMVLPHKFWAMGFFDGSLTLQQRGHAEEIVCFWRYHKGWLAIQDCDLKNSGSGPSHVHFHIFLPHVMNHSSHLCEEFFAIKNAVSSLRSFTSCPGLRDYWSLSLATNTKVHFFCFCLWHCWVSIDKVKAYSRLSCLL